MVTSTYALEEFIHDMSEEMKKDISREKLLDRGSVLMERLVGNPDCIPSEYRVPSGRGKSPNHGSYLLHRGGNGLLLSAEVWGPGDHVGPHDHHTWGMIGVIENVLQEIRFRRVDDGSKPEFSRLEKDRELLTRPGEIALLMPGTDEIHQIDNTDDRPTVEIHVYGDDLGKISRCKFDLNTGKVSAFVSGSEYDNM